MHGLVIALFCSILGVEYLVEQRRLLHPYAILIPELLSGIVMLVVLLRLMNGTRVSLDWRYGLFLLALLFTIAFGYAVQDVPTGAMLAGARTYLKFLPFFLLPAVHRFTPRQLQVQLAVLLVFALLQTPLAFYQRFIEFGDDMHTGDPVRGTLTASSGMSLFMIGAIAGIVIAYLRGRMRLAVMLALAAWLFAATTINETKATLLLLPVALLVPAFLMGKGRAVRRLMPLVAVGALAVVAFVAAYNYFVQFREYPGSLGDYFTAESLTYYLYTGAANTDQPYVGRFDSIELALEHTATDPLKLAFGYGAGNVSESFLPGFAGRYWDYYVRFGVGQTQVTQFLWEIGVAGLLAYLFLYYLVARDALYLARSKDSAAAIGQLWVVAMIVMTFGLLYKSLLSMNDFGYLFWYFSGIVASRAASIRQTASSRVPRRAPPTWRLATDGPHARAGASR
jgi:O-antigen ligase